MAKIKCSQCRDCRSESCKLKCTDLSVVHVSRIRLDLIRLTKFFATFLIFETCLAVAFNPVNGQVYGQPSTVPNSHYNKNQNFHTIQIKSPHQQNIQRINKFDKHQKVDQNYWASPNIQSGPVTHLPEPKPRHDELKEKLGFSLSSLLPTSILNLPQQSPQGYENSYAETGSTNDNSAFLDDTELRQNPIFSNNDNPALTPEITSSEQDTGDNPSSEGLFSRLRNRFSFGNGLLSGLLMNANGGNEAQPDNSEPAIPGDNSPTTNELFSGSNPLSLINTADNTNAASSPLSNPLQSIQNLLNINPASDSPLNLPLNVNPGQGQGGYDSSDSTITALQSLAGEDGLGGVLGVGSSLLSTVADTIGITGKNASLFILVGLALAPLIATGIAASVVGIVYAAIYIPAAAIRNEDLDGEFYMIQLKQLFDILGIPDPIEELLENLGLPPLPTMLNFQKRSLETPSFGMSEASKKAFLTRTVHESEQCFERFACEVIGRKLILSPGKKRSPIVKAIEWMASKFGNDSSESKGLEGISFYSRAMKMGGSIVKAVATGMSPRITNGTTKTNGKIGAVGKSLENLDNKCMNYICDPIRQVRKLFKNFQ